MNRILPVDDAGVDASKPFPTLADTGFLKRNLHGHNNSQSVERRYLRHLSVLTTTTAKGELKRRGLKLLNDGQKFVSRDAKWPQCVPRHDVSLPGTRVHQDCMDIADDIARGHLVTVRTLSIRQRSNALRLASLRRLQHSSSTASSLHHSSSFLSTASFYDDSPPNHVDAIRSIWLRQCRLWFDAVAQSHYSPAGTTTKSPAATGAVCPHRLNDIPLRHISTIYPNMGFRPPGVNVGSSAAVARSYEATTLRPLRRAMKLYAHRRSNLRTSSRSFLL